jgi:hypothetical protein
MCFQHTLDLFDDLYKLFRRGSVGESQMHFDTAYAPAGKVLYGGVGNNGIWYGNE